MDIDLKKCVTLESTADPEERVTSRKEVKRLFEHKYLNQSEGKSEKSKSGVEFFFKKLRF